MSDYQARPGTGTLFKNDRKRTDRDPDMTGSVAMPDGREHWVSAWWNQKNGTTWLKFNIGREKEARDQGHARQGRPEHPAERSTAYPPMGHREPLPVHNPPKTDPWAQQAPAPNHWDEPVPPPEEPPPYYPPGGRR